MLTNGVVIVQNYRQLSQNQYGIPINRVNVFIQMKSVKWIRSFLQLISTVELLWLVIVVLLLFYEAVGCPIPKHPKQGYLVHGNTSHAEFMCCVDHVFPDTGFRFKNLTCQQGYRWSENLPDCVGNQHLHPL